MYFFSEIVSIKNRASCLADVMATPCASFALITVGEAVFATRFPPEIGNKYYFDYFFINSLGGQIFIATFVSHRRAKVYFKRASFSAIMCIFC